MSTNENLIQAIAATAEVCNKTFSPAAAKIFADDLAEYRVDDVLKALTRCRKDLKGQFTLESVISRISDGRPNQEEAWAICALALSDERVTIVMTAEMQAALAMASNLEYDPVAARMAFRETYNRLVSESREKKIPVKWNASLGHDSYGREGPLVDAVEKGRLSAEHAMNLLPNITHTAMERLEHLSGKFLEIKK